MKNSNQVQQNINIRFKYLGDTSFSKGNGKITIAYSGLQCGLAFCSPNDVYSKKLGKKIAIGRLSTNPITMVYKPVTYNQWIDFIYSGIQIPNWLYKDSKI